ncbi:hypothetical protein LUZ60_000168 [Juncus effusus]|nr:hypothetical protein LUZ60_000168 [Juncus effusus]
MESGRLVFGTAVGSHCGRQQMFLLNDGNSSIFPGGKRPFFTMAEELLEEEYYDEQLPEKKRRLTPEQVVMLERSFEEENKLEPDRKSELARKLGLQPRQVAVWFQNRRARWKTKSLEHDFNRLKSSYDSLFSEHETLVEDNQRLRSQVMALTEQLQAKESSSISISITDLPKPEILTSTSETEAPQIPAIHSAINSAIHSPIPHEIHLKAEDRLSSDSKNSSIVYFPEEDEYCLAGGTTTGGFQSEEEDGHSDEGCNYYAGTVFDAQLNDGVCDDGQMGWWVWS